MNPAPHHRGWDGLAAELDRWGEAGRVASVWWRDDDVVAATSRLFDLLDLAAGAPLALAAIPGLVRPSLVEALAGRPHVAVVQHGWQHVNRAGAGAKKSEYPPSRGVAAVAAEIAAGRARLVALFGPRALPVFVPPWNRFADEFLTILPGSGIAVLSGMATPRPPAMPPGLAALDIDLDLVAWPRGGGFIGEAAALTALVDALRRRRRAGGDRPVGLLTHHLVLDPAAAGFIARLIRLARGHRALRWAAAADLL